MSFFDERHEPEVDTHRVHRVVLERSQRTALREFLGRALDTESNPVLLAGIVRLLSALETPP